MDGIKDMVNKIILDPDYADILAIVKAARNGAVYGTKIRFPHAVVMVFLFRDGTFREKCSLIFKMTRRHASNLARFAAVYKFMMMLQARTRASPDAKEAPWEPFISGLVGGYYVFGRGHQSSVSQQIVIYIFARVMLGLAKLSVQSGMVPNPEGATTGNAWPVFASLSWATVMWLFRYYPEVIQPSLKSSMKYIYADSDHWDSFRNFLIYNV